MIPGLVNTPHHMYQSLTRAIRPARDRELFGWLQTLSPGWAGLTPEMTRVSAQTALAELLLSGATTSSDHLYIYPNGTRLDDSIEAAEIGMRFHAARGSMSVGQLQGGLPPDRVVERGLALPLPLRCGDADVPTRVPMNLPLSELPERCEVLVVGAGPAGSAAATLLAASGLQVVLIDQRAFPRDKVCGDGLIPDAHAALAKLGLLDEVMAHARPAAHVACIGPRGGRIDVPGRLAVLPRRELDDIVCRGAVRAGARMHAPVQFDEPLLDGAGRVCGAKVSHARVQREIRADWVVLASGAVPQAMKAAGLCERQTPTGVAMRAYVKNDAMVGRITEMEVVWHRLLRPGYGWIFPCCDGVFNIGAGVVDSHGRNAEGRNVMHDVNLKRVFDAFCETYAPARELVAGGTLLGGLKGAPLRCTLAGARYTRAGLLATGEAVGSTYSFTGEGIGKALETGMLAASAMLEGRQRGLDDAAVRQHYEAGLLALKPRFDLYARANRVNAHPWLIDLLIWRARKSVGLVRRMSGVLNETSNPGNLISARGIARLFTE